MKKKREVRLTIIKILLNLEGRAGTGHWGKES